MMTRSLFAALLCIVVGPPIAFAATFTVTTNADSGAGSMRQAILDANALAGVDDIHFNIGAGGPQIISLTSPLPSISGTVNIDGTTQPGFASTPIITLDGNNAPGNGLTLNSSGSTIRGLVIVDFGGAGIAIHGENATIAGNYIGIDASGLVADGNGAGIDVDWRSDGNIIGGTAAADRNVISANGVGIAFNSFIIDSFEEFGSSNDNIVQGNIIGLDATASNALGNASVGVLISCGDNNRIGGTAPGAGNVIAGNASEGIRISSRDHRGSLIPGDAAIANVIEGNRIGTNGAGNVARPNAGDGLSMNGTPGTTVGGTAAGAGNIISGNGGNGIRLSGVSSFRELVIAQNTVIQGNFIGTDSTGTLDIGNGLHGIVVLSAARNNTIGGAAAGEGNVISGNGQSGITFSSLAVLPAITGNVVLGNRIGTDVSGTVALPNGGAGILFSGPGTGNNSIAGNVISGNGQSGITFSSLAVLPALTGNAVHGNRIGTDVSGTVALPNGGAGILFSGPGTGNNIIGGNTIRFNNDDGITVLGGSHNGFFGNSIDLNDQLGIRLDGAGANDARDPDTGPNNLQNHPVLTSASVIVTTNVTGTFNSTPGGTFRIEFFNSPAADPTGFGEGATFLGFTNVTTSPSGNAAIAASLPAVTEGTVITATATDLFSFDTSQFSNAIVVAPLTLNIGDVTLFEPDSGTANAVFTVTLTAPAPVDVTFNYATGDGTATAPGDYTSTNGTGLIPAGGLSTTISVPVVGDMVVEPDETFVVNVTNIAGAVGGDTQGQATITNEDAVAIPTLSTWALLLMAIAFGIGGLLKLSQVGV